MNTSLFILIIEDDPSRAQELENDIHAICDGMEGLQSTIKSVTNRADAEEILQKSESTEHPLSMFVCKPTKTSLTKRLLLSHVSEIPS
jgi:hypothetical protein